MKRMTMHLAPLTAFFCCVGFSAEAPSVPPTPLAEKRQLLLSENFDSTNVSPLWHRVVPTFVITNGALMGSQTREKDVLGPDGKVTVKAHAAVHGLELPTRNTIVEAKIRFEGASMIDIEFDDRKYTNAHYGHLCRAQFRTNGVTLMDERDGGMRLDIRAMASDPSKKEERAKLMAGRQVTFPMAIAAGVWHSVMLETVGECMRVTVDGKPAAFLKSSGIGHETKSKLEFGVAGKSGLIDEIRIWNAEPLPAKQAP